MSRLTEYEDQKGTPLGDDALFVFDLSIRGARRGITRSHNIYGGNTVNWSTPDRNKIKNYPTDTTTLSIPRTYEYTLSFRGRGRGGFSCM